MQTALYGKIKERRERQDVNINWTEYTKHTLPFNCSNTIQNKTKARKGPIDEG